MKEDFIFLKTILFIVFLGLCVLFLYAYFEGWLAELIFFSVIGLGVLVFSICIIVSNIPNESDYGEV